MDSSYSNNRVPAASSRVVEILREHLSRLPSCKETGPTEASDLLIGPLLPVLRSYASNRAKEQTAVGLGNRPESKYHKPHPNSALIKLCKSAIENIESLQQNRITVPTEFLKTHCVNCGKCGQLFLAKRSDARYCGNTCQRGSKRRTMSELNRLGV